MSVLEPVRERARERAARARLNVIEEIRDVAALDAAGLPQRAIAAAIGTTQPRVGRILKNISIFVPSVEIAGGTPAEIILRTIVQHGDRQQMMRLLVEYPYTFGEDAPYPAEGATSGTWDQVKDALFEGWITEDEFQEISAVVRR